MLIANPIYDVVFKYLLDDSKIAKMIISAIIGEEIESLDFMPRESIMEVGNRSLTVYRIDFSAKIRTLDGFKLVLIEIQKAKFSTDIMRFRKYLGEQYQNKENFFYDQQTGKKRIIPIINIFFLGHKLDHAKAPVIKVQRQYYDLTTGKEIIEKEEFIESLTHDSYIIQIPFLREKQQTELEQLLGIFNQDHAADNQHVLNIDEKDYPEKFKEIIRRLQRAIAEPDFRQKMDIEDEVLQELADLERVIEKKDKALEEKDKALEEKDKALEEKGKELEDKEKELEEIKAEKDAIIEELKKKLKEKR